MEQELPSAFIRELQEMMRENPPSVIPLPIYSVFVRLASKDDKSGKATLNIDVNCDRFEPLPDPVRLVIRTPLREIFNEEVSLSPLRSDMYRGRNMMRTTIELSELDFAQIYNNFDAEITFTDGEKESILPIYV